MPSSVISYIHHYLGSRSKYDLHSPFVYKFYSEILTDKTEYPEYRKAEDLKTSLMKHKGEIRMNDYGAHGNENVLVRKTVLVRKIARTSSVSQKSGRLLFRLSHVLRPVSVLELGTSLGISAAYLASGNPECPVVTVEGCGETAAFAKEQLDTLGLGNIRVINSRFEDVLSYLLPEIGVLGMVFFDGNHRKEATLDYFQQCLPFIHDETVFIFDDIHWSPEMEEAWAMIREHESVKITIDLFRMGLVFFREGLSKEDFILRF